MSVISVSRIVVISDGARHMSAIRLDKGRSIFCAENMVNGPVLCGFADATYPATLEFTVQLFAPVL